MFHLSINKNRNKCKIVTSWLLETSLRIVAKRCGFWAPGRHRIWLEHKWTSTSFIKWEKNIWVLIYQGDVDCVLNLHRNRERFATVELDKRRAYCNASQSFTIRPRETNLKKKIIKAWLNYGSLGCSEPFFDGVDLTLTILVEVDLGNFASNRVANSFIFFEFLKLSSNSNMKRNLNKNWVLGFGSIVLFGLKSRVLRWDVLVSSHPRDRFAVLFGSFQVGCRGCLVFEQLLVHFVHHGFSYIETKLQVEIWIECSNKTTNHPDRRGCSLGWSNQCERPSPARWVYPIWIVFPNLSSCIGQNVSDWTDKLWTWDRTECRASCSDIWCGKEVRCHHEWVVRSDFDSLINQFKRNQ